MSHNILSLQVFVDVSRFSPCVINLSRNENICCEVEKVVAKRARVYFEQQILASLLVFHQTHNLSGNKFARAQANQPIRAPHFFNPQQMLLLRVKLITQSEKTRNRTKTCNQTMNVAPQVEGFGISYFAALKFLFFKPPIHTSNFRINYQLIYQHIANTIATRLRYFVCFGQ